MKTACNTIIPILLFALLASCAPKSSDTSDEYVWEAFGDEINPSGYVMVSDVIDQFELDTEKEFKISGTLKEVCQNKGCWTTLDTEDGREIRMSFKDYGFFLPNDHAGKTAIADGVGFIKMSSVDVLRHMAEDAGKSEEEIAAITEPRQEYLFVARGVLTR